MVFFCRHTCGPKGPFIVLKSKDDNAIRRLDLTDANFNPWPYQFRSTDAALAAVPEAVELGRVGRHTGGRRVRFT